MQRRSIFVEARGCDGTNLCFIERPRYFLGSLLVSGLEGGEIMSIILLTRDSCFNQMRTNLGAECLCKNGSSEGSGQKPRYICRVKQLQMTVFLVARLIKDKADASSTVNQSVM